MKLINGKTTVIFVVNYTISVSESSNLEMSFKFSPKILCYYCRLSTFGHIWPDLLTKTSFCVIVSK